MWGAILAVVAGLTPFALKIFTTHTFSQWWDGFTFAKWGYFLTDYFSPCLTNLVSSPEKFFSNITPMFAFWGIVPTIIAVVWLARALANSKQNRKLFGICLGVVFVLTLAAMFGKLVFTTKYSIEIYPILLYLIAVGALKIDKKLLKNSLISVYCVLMLGYNFVSSTAAPRARRAQGNKIPAEFIEHAQLKSGDFIILEYYPQNRFEKYIDFSKYNVKNITRYLREKKNVSVTPYNTLIFEACSEGKIIDYFLSLKNIDESDRNYLFIKEVNNNVTAIIDKLQELQMRL